MVLAPEKLSLRPMHFFKWDICWQKYRLVHLVNVSCLSMGTHDVDKFRKPSAGPGQITLKICTPEDSILGSRKKVVCIWKTKLHLQHLHRIRKKRPWDSKQWTTVLDCVQQRVRNVRDDFKLLTLHDYKQEYNFGKCLASLIFQDNTLFCAWHSCSLVFRLNYAMCPTR